MPERKEAQLPPQNLDAEESVLGAMLLSPSAIDHVVELVEAEDFYRASHGSIFVAILDLYDSDSPVDEITVADWLERSGQLADCGGRQRIHELSALVPSTSNVKHYAGIVRELSVLRGLIRAGFDIQREAWERDATSAELIDRAGGRIFDLARERRNSDVLPIARSLDGTFAEIEQAYKDGKPLVGLSAGLNSIDRLTYGFQRSNLIVLAGRPSMGKTAIALGILRHVAVVEQKPAVLFTLEMSKREVDHRLLSMDALVEMQKLRTGNLDREEWERLFNSRQRLDAAPLYVDDSGLLTMTELRSKARRLKMRHPDLALVVLDYLQLMASGGDLRLRQQEVSQLSRSLKVLCGELDVPVIALSQLSRRVEDRHDKRPLLSDLRESGSIEQDADLVAFVYREEYYNPEDVEVQGLAEFILAKQRNGPIGDSKLSFVKRYARFSDMPRPGAGDVR